jgi:hypothetical protein
MVINDVDAIAPSRVVKDESWVGIARWVASAVIGTPGKRRVASAGALYPYSIVAILRRLDGSVDARSFDWKPGELSDLGVLSEVGALADDLDLARGEVAVLISIRPWLSMRKYGPRGYWYSLLDAGHAVANLLCVGELGGVAPVVDRAADLTVMDAALARALPWHQTQAVLRAADMVNFRPPNPLSEPLDITVREARVPSSRRNEHDYERWAWEWISDNFDNARSLVSTGAVKAPPQMRENALWANVIRNRRSAKEFSDVPGPDINGSPFALVAESGILGLGGLRMSVVVTDPTALAMVDESGQLVVDKVVIHVDGAELIAACMEQVHIRDATAFIVLHAPTEQISDADPEQFRSAMLLAGVAGHLLHLGVQAAGGGVTTIGGFVEGAWGRILDTRDNIVSVLALGSTPVTATPGKRLDVEGRAHAHGER